MGKGIYLRLTGAIFGIVFCLHIFRLTLHWQVTIAGWTAPIWFSWPGMVASGALCVWAFRLAAAK